MSSKWILSKDVQKLLIEVIISVNEPEFYSFELEIEGAFEISFKPDQSEFGKSPERFTIPLM